MTGEGDHRDPPEAGIESGEASSNPAAIGASSGLPYTLGDIKGMLSVAGKVAGIGGLALVVLLGIYWRVIESGLLSTLGRGESALVLSGVVVFVFIVTLVAIYVYLIKPLQGVDGRIVAASYLGLVLIVLIFAGGMFYIAVNAGALGSPAVQLEPLREGYQHYRNRNYDAATQSFEQAAKDEPSSPAPWYWLARTAQARQQSPVALANIDKALARDANHAPTLALSVKLLLEEGRFAEARQRAQEISQSGRALREWSVCLERAGLFEEAFVTDGEIERRCPSPDYEWQMG